MSGAPWKEGVCVPVFLSTEADSNGWLSFFWFVKLLLGWSGSERGRGRHYSQGLLWATGKFWNGVFPKMPLWLLCWNEFCLNQPQIVALNPSGNELGRSQGGSDSVGSMCYISRDVVKVKKSLWKRFHNQVTNNTFNYTERNKGNYSLCQHPGLVAPQPGIHIWWGCYPLVETKHFRFKMGLKDEFISPGNIPFWSMPDGPSIFPFEPLSALMAEVPPLCFLSLDRLRPACKFNKGNDLFCLIPYYILSA